MTRSFAPDLADDRGARYVALDCTSGSGLDGPGPAHLVTTVSQALDAAGATGSSIRLADHDLSHGGDRSGARDHPHRDDWRSIRRRILEADLVVLGTPSHRGRSSSVASLLMERLEADFDRPDEQILRPLVDKVAVVCAVGEETHLVGAELCRALNDLGFTLPPGAMTSWSGEDPEVPDATVDTASTMVRHALRLGLRLSGSGHDRSATADGALAARVASDPAMSQVGGNVRSLFSRTFSPTPNGAVGVGRARHHDADGSSASRVVGAGPLFALSPRGGRASA